MTSESLNDSSYEIINHDEDGIKFSLPFVNDNVEGWGPNNVPEKYKDLPYQKFSKSDRIGKVTVWAWEFDFMKLLWIRIGRFLLSFNGIESKTWYYLDRRLD